MKGNKKCSYIAESKRQIEEFELYKAMFFHLYDTTESEVLKFRGIEKMTQMNIALVNMHNLLPQIAQNVPIDVVNNNKNDYNDDKDLSAY